MSKKQTILIVDDDERNIRLLKAMLAREEYCILSANGGEEAMEVVKKTPPDLILLDVMMPGIDGFEVCKRVKHHDDTRSIPIVMVTALTEKEDRIRAMKAGADDFLSKPVDKTELYLRIKSLLRIKSYHDRMTGSYREIAEKNRKLSELEKIREDLTHMLIHDLNNPLFSLYMAIETLLLDNEGFSEKQVKTLKDCVDNCKDLKVLVRNILDVYRMEDTKIVPVKELTDLPGLIRDTVGMFAVKIEAKQIALSFSGETNTSPLPVDPDLMRRVVTNIVANAVRHTPERGEIEIDIQRDNEKGNLIVNIKDSGEGILPEYHQKVFDKFQQVELKNAGIESGSSGLGLPFCKLAVEAHGGRIWLESAGQGSGCVFVFTLPLSPSGADPDTE